MNVSMNILRVIWPLVVGSFIVASGFAQDSIEKTRLMRQEVDRLVSTGKIREAIDSQIEIIKHQETLFGPFSIEAALAITEKAALHRFLKQTEEAEIELKRALKLLDRATGLPQNALIRKAEVLQALAYMNFSKERLDDAEIYYKRVIEIRERIDGTESPTLAPLLMSVGNIHHMKAEYDDAKSIYERLLRLRVKTDGVENPDTTDIRIRYECSARRVDKSTRTAAETLIKSLGFSEESEKLEPNESENARAREEKGYSGGKAISLARPFPSAVARSQNLESVVKVRVSINENGIVTFACSISGNALLHKSSEDAAYRSKFTPTFHNGKAVKVAGLITYNYKRRNGPEILMRKI